MPREIKDLIDELKFAAICNQIEQGNKPNENLALITNKKRGNFDWGDTRQGSIFWDNVSDGIELNYDKMLKYGD